MLDLKHFTSLVMDQNTPQSFHMVYVKGKCSPSQTYSSFEAAQQEADRLAAFHAPLEVFVMAPVQQVQVLPQTIRTPLK
jgi:hypothetical protein